MQSHSSASWCGQKKPPHFIASAQTRSTPEECLAQATMLLATLVLFMPTRSGTVRGKHLPSKGRKCGEEGEGEKEILSG